jgi:hypothetical protein
MVGTLLEPRPEIAEAFAELDRRWQGSCVGMFDSSLERILEYRRNLRELAGPAVDCEWSFRDFEEGIYPLDISGDALDAVTAEVLPADLDDLIVWQDDLARMIGGSGRWRLYLLGSNCA